MAAIEYKPVGSFGGLLIKNALKSLITLYIYRFWAKTAVRRYFWQAIRLDGDPFEYTGLGRELLIGFLIVIAILAPILLGWNAVRAALRGNAIGLGIAQIVYFFALYCLIIAAGFRARRYRLSRTRWRGIRAGQDGSTWAYLGLAIAWGALSLVTLGFAAPWMRTALQRYRTRHTLFGDQRFSFEARALPLLAKWLVVMVATAVPLIVAGILAAPALHDLITASTRGAAAIQAVAPRLAGLALVPYIAVLMGGLAYGWYRAAEFRHFAAHTALGRIRFESKARGGTILTQVFLCLLAELGCLVVGVGVLTMAITIVAVSTGTGLSPASTSRAAAVAWGVGSGIAAALLLLFILRFLWAVIVTAPVLRHFCETLDLSEVEPLSQVAQSAAVTPKYGEGLADSFDFGAM